MIKNKERLENNIWDMMDAVKGKYDGWDFHHTILGLIIYRLISERVKEYMDKDNDPFPNLYDAMMIDMGFFLPYSHFFESVRRDRNNDDNLSTRLSEVFYEFDQSTAQGKKLGSLNGIFNGINLTINNQTLQKIMDIIAEIGNTGGVDIIGPTFEYLNKLYSVSSGRPGGEFFTPPEIGELLAKIATSGKFQVLRAYDPTCGSGSLLLQVGKLIGHNNIFDGYYAQELNTVTHNICRANLIINGVDFKKINIANGDTLEHPIYWEDGNQERLKFDVIVSNPPYSTKWAGNNNKELINDERFRDVGTLAPKNNSDFAFILHSFYLLEERGTAAIVVFPGILYRGGAEEKIREYLISINAIDAIISLPAKLFTNTTIATSIIVLKKNRATKDILFINAAQEFEKLERNKSSLTKEGIKRIIECYEARKDDNSFSRVVHPDLIKENNYVLSVNSYFHEERKPITYADIEEINAEVAKCHARYLEQYKELNNIIAEIEGKRTNHRTKHAGKTI